MVCENTPSHAVTVVTANPPSSRGSESTSGSRNHCTSIQASASNVQPRPQLIHICSGVRHVNTVHVLTPRAASSMAGWNHPIHSPQCLQRPRSTAKLSKGNKSKGPSGAPQVAHAERETTTDLLAGNRTISTPSRLPTNGAASSGQIQATELEPASKSMRRLYQIAITLRPPGAANLKSISACLRHQLSGEPASVGSTGRTTFREQRQRPIQRPRRLDACSPPSASFRGAPALRNDLPRPSYLPRIRTGCPVHWAKPARWSTDHCIPSARGNDPPGLAQTTRRGWPLQWGTRPTPRAADGSRRTGSPERRHRGQRSAAPAAADIASCS